MKEDALRLANSARLALLSVCTAAATLLGANAAWAQPYSSDLSPGRDPRGRAELVVCSQNLDNYGSYTDMKRRNVELSLTAYRQKETALVVRIVEAGCDALALQEVLGATEQASKEALAHLARKLAARTGRSYQVVVGPSNDPFIRPGFIIAMDRAEIVNKVSYVNAELPKITAEERQRYFSRGPLELQLRVKPFDDEEVKTVSLINFHFKSRSMRGGRDPSGLEWEPFRMAMAEGLRRIVDARMKEPLSSGESILVLLGDRNSNFDTATARILEGILTLKDFQGEAPCRLSKRGVPLCKAGTAEAQRYFSVLLGDPATRRLQGTIQYGKVYSWFDDIIMPAESLPYAWLDYAKAGSYACGVIYRPRAASDHALVWARLNW